MRIGLDFDNTIVRYGDLFHTCALERGLISVDVPATKTAVRDEIRKRSGNGPWVELQGLVYGARMEDAEAAPGVRPFLQRCNAAGHRVSVVSFRTRYAEAGPRYDLHAAAREWLERQEFYSSGLLTPLSVFLEETLEAKLRRVRELHCDLYVDDLLDNLLHPSFPDGVTRVVFAPANSDVPPGIQVCLDWNAVESLVFGS